MASVPEHAILLLCDCAMWCEKIFMLSFAELNHFRIFTVGSHQMKVEFKSEIAVLIFRGKNEAKLDFNTTSKLDQRKFDYNLKIVTESACQWNRHVSVMREMNKEKGKKEV